MIFWGMEDHPNLRQYHIEINISEFSNHLIFFAEAFVYQITLYSFCNVKNKTTRSSENLNV